jgi:hypothetical protein
MITGKPFTVTIYACVALLLSCSKHTPVPSAGKLTYGDSVFYIKNAAYTITPLNGGTGTYSAFPNNLQIDNNTGAVTITIKGKDGQSQTGLRYRIMYTSPSSNHVDSTFIILSGISYFDKFYYLNQNDSIITPVYNADRSKPVPAGNYDIAHDNRFAISPATGQININETIRRGYFNDLLPNTSWKQTTVRYAINDNSGGVENAIDVILYYYNQISDVPVNVSALMQAHQQMSLSANIASIPSTNAPVDNNLSSNLSLSRPRPPCVVIIGH